MVPLPYQNIFCPAFPGFLFCLVFILFYFRALKSGGEQISATLERAEFSEAQVIKKLMWIGMIVLLCVICDVSGIWQSLALISKSSLCSQEAGLGRWGQRVSGAGIRLGLSCRCHCVVSPNCSSYFVSSSKQIVKQVKLTLPY